MEAYNKDPKKAQEEKSQQEREELEAQAYKEAMEAFRKSPAYPFIMELIDQKIKQVTDIRCLAESFGRIKAEIIGDLGILGTSSLMASKPLEEIKQELE